MMVEKKAAATMMLMLPVMMPIGGVGGDGGYD